MMGARLADALDASLAIVQVHSDGAGRPTGWELYDGGRRLTDAVEAAGLGDLPVRMVERYGAPGEQLAVVAGELDADLVVVAGDPRNRWRSLPSPSAAADVTRLADRPVVVAPPASRASVPARMGPRTHRAGV
jgi:nucleotide-binding universal stress UspA family protein